MIKFFAKRMDAILIWAAILYFLKFIGYAMLAGVSMACADGGACGSWSMHLLSIRFAAPYVLAFFLNLVCIGACRPIEPLREAVAVAFLLHLTWIGIYTFAEVKLNGPRALEIWDDLYVPVLLVLVVFAIATGVVRLPQRRSRHT